MNILPVEDIIKWRMRGVHPADIAKRLKVPRKRISRKLGKLKDARGLKFPRIIKEGNSLPLSLIAEAAELYASGLTLDQVGEKYNVARETVRATFKRHKIKTRSVKESWLPRITKACKRGHDLTGKNRGKYKSGNLKCLQCAGERKAGLYRRTHCKKGHKLEGWNIYKSRKYQKGKLYISIACRTCHNERVKVRLKNPKIREQHRKSCRGYYRKNRKRLLAYSREYQKKNPRAKK